LEKPDIPPCSKEKGWLAILTIRMNATKGKKIAWHVGGGGGGVQGKKKGEISSHRGGKTEKASLGVAMNICFVLKKRMLSGKERKVAQKKVQPKKDSSVLGKNNEDLVLNLARRKNGGGGFTRDRHCSSRRMEEKGDREEENSEVGMKKPDKNGKLGEEGKMGKRRRGDTGEGRWRGVGGRNRRESNRRGEEKGIVSSLMKKETPGSKREKKSHAKEE